MLAELLYGILPYQIFKSVLFRAGMGYVTVYFLISLIMPFAIRYFRKKGYVSDFKKQKFIPGAYAGATPIMGGIVLIFAILVSVILWNKFTPAIVASLVIIVSFGFIGFLDDFSKIRSLRSGKEEEKKEYAEKADGISGKVRLLLEFLVTGIVISGLLLQTDTLSPYLQIPGIPIKNWLPEIPMVLLIPFLSLVVVGGANAVNLNDGLDTLATIPMLSALLFVAAASYIGGEPVWSERLKMIFLGENIKQISIFSVVMIGALISFLKYNSPPANIYLGDTGALGIGGVVCLLFIFIKAELFLPIVGGGFVITALSAIIQRTWFFATSKLKGREYAKLHRFFYRAPYHHHKQAQYDFHGSKVISIYDNLLSKITPKWWPQLDRYASKESINNKVIWHSHIKTLWFLVIAFIIYFKVR